MSETPLPIQNDSMGNPTSGTDDCNVQTPHAYPSPLVDSSSPDKTIETSGPRARQGGDRARPPLTPEILAFRNSYPHNATYSHQRSECVEESSLGHTEQYHPSSPFGTNAFGHPDARPGSPPALVAAAPMYAPQDYMLHLSSALVHPSPSILPQHNPSFHLESNARPPLGTATSSRAYMGGASGHHDDPTGHQHHSSPPIYPFAGPGYGGNVMFDALVPHPTPDHVIQRMRRMHLNSEASSPPHPEFASQQPSVDSPPAGYAEPRFFSPENIEVNSWDPPSAFPAPAYGGNNYPTRYSYPLENSTQSWGEQMSTGTHGEAVSGQNYRHTLPPYSNTGHESGGPTTTPSYYGSSMTMMFDQMPDPRFSLQMYFPAYAPLGQVAPVTMHATGEGNSSAGSFASSDERYNYPLRHPATWEGKKRPSTTIANRTHRGPSWPYQHRAHSSSTSTIYSNDVAINTPPRNMPPVQHGNLRRRNASSTSTSALQGTSSAPDGGHFAASPSAFTDEDPTDCSPPPATCPPMTGLNTQQVLRRVLGPSPRLKNEALIQLILLVLHASFYRMNEMEPTRDSEEGRALLKQIQEIPGCPLNAFDVSSDSIFILFVSHSKFRCLICASSKQSMVRAIGCVRSHLDHRPFPCVGEDGCKSCPQGQIVKRFFTASLLHDHCSKQERAIGCTYCGRTYTSNIKRHWESKHKHTPFPYEDYPNYQNE